MENNDDLRLFACGAAVALIGAIPFVLDDGLLYPFLAAVGGGCVIRLIVHWINRREDLRLTKRPGDAP